MRLTRKHQTPAIGLNMTPMIDIVFLLIVFFMTVSQITHNVASEVRLPEVESAEDSGLEFALEILLDRNGDIQLDGLPVVPSTLNSGVRQFAARANAKISRLQVQLRIDRECDSALVNEVFEILAAAGVERVYSAVLNAASPGK